MRALTPAPSWLDRELWPHSPRWFEGQEGTLHYVDEGQGPPVLFVHGTPTWSIDWRHLIAGLREDHRCIAVDHLGFGLSERPEHAGYRPEDHAPRFASFADSLDLRGATVVVHDYGGPIALPWVLDNLDRVDRLVVINSFAWPFEDRATRVLGSILGGPLGRWAYRWLNLSLRFVAPSAWADRSRLTPQLFAQHLAPFEDRADRVRVLWALARALLASEAYYSSLAERLPELSATQVDLVWGMKDPAFPPAVLQRWRAELPHARVTEIDDAGHWPHEEQALRVLEALRT